MRKVILISLVYMIINMTVYTLLICFMQVYFCRDDKNSIVLWHCFNLNQIQSKPSNFEKFKWWLICTLFINAFFGSGLILLSIEFNFTTFHLTLHPYDRCNVLVRKRAFISCCPFLLKTDISKKVPSMPANQLRNTKCHLKHVEIESFFWKNVYITVYSCALCTVCRFMDIQRHIIDFAVVEHCIRPSNFYI